MELLLLDMDLIVKTTMAIEREVDDARSIRDTGVKDKRAESQPSSYSLGNKDFYSSRVSMTGPRLSGLRPGLIILG